MVGPTASCISLSTFPAHVEATFTLLITLQWHMMHQILHYTSRQSTELLSQWFFPLAGLKACFMECVPCIHSHLLRPCRTPYHLGLTPAQKKDPVVNSLHATQPLALAQGKLKENTKFTNAVKRSWLAATSKGKRQSPNTLTNSTMASFQPTWRGTTSNCVNKRQHKYSFNCHFKGC